MPKPKFKGRTRRKSDPVTNRNKLNNKLITAQVNQASTWLAEQLENTHKHFEKMASYVYNQVLPNNASDTVRPLTLNSYSSPSIPPLHLGQSLTVHNSANPTPSNTRSFDTQQEWLSPRIYQNRDPLSFDAIKQKIIEISSSKGESLWRNILNNFIQLDVNRTRSLHQDDIFNILNDYDIHLSIDERRILYKRYNVQNSYMLMNYVNLLQDICPNPMSLNLDHINSARRNSSHLTSSINNNNNTYNPYNDPSLKRDRYSDYTTTLSSMNDLNRSQSIQPSSSLRYNDNNNLYSTQNNNYRPYNDPLNPSVNNPNISNLYNNSYNSPVIVSNPLSSSQFISQPQPQPPQYISPPQLFQSQSLQQPQLQYNPTNLYSSPYTSESINEIIKKLKQLHDDNVWIGISVEGLEKILGSSNRPDLDGIIHLLGLPLTENEIKQIVSYYQTKLNGNPIAKRDVYELFGDFIRESDYSKLKQTNIALQKELSSFDNQFFDEIEDLKYKYNQQILRTQKLEDRLMTLCEHNGISAASLLSNLPGSSSVSKETEWEPSKKLEKILHLTKSGNFIPESIRKYLNSRNNSGEIALDRLWILCQENDPLHTQLIDVRTFKSILRSLLPPSIFIDSDVERLIIKFTIPSTNNLNYINLCNELRIKDMYTTLDSPFIHNLQSTSVGGTTSSPIRSNTKNYVLPLTQSTPLQPQPIYQPIQQQQQQPYYTNNPSQPVFSMSYTNNDDPISYIRDLIHSGKWKGISKNEMMNYLSKFNPDNLTKYELRSLIDHFNVPLRDNDKANAIINSFGTKDVLSLREALDKFNWLNPQIDYLNNNNRSMNDEEKVILSEVHKCLLAMSEINDCQFDPNKAFSLIDINNDNQITYAEFVEFLRQSGFTLYQTQVKKLFNYIDKSKNGYISRKELLEFFDNGFLKSGEALSAVDLLRYCIHRLSMKRNGNIDLKQCFMRFDTDRNGTISQKEFKTALNQLGINISEERYKSLFNEIPHNSRGTLDSVKKQETEMLIRKKLERMRVSGNYKSVFRRFDKDNSNSISKSEFLKMTKDIGVPLSEADVQWLFSEIDLNNNGKISYTEFESFLQKNRNDSFLSPTDVVEILMTRILEKLKKDPSFLKKMFAQSDLNNNKKLNKQEFYLMLKRNIQITEEESDNAFNKYDKNRDGSISLSEFREAVFDAKKKHNQLTKLVLELKQVDRFKTGFIGRKSFIDILSKHTNKNRTELENIATQFTKEGDLNQIDYRQFIRYNNRCLF